MDNPWPTISNLQSTILDLVREINRLNSEITRNRTNVKSIFTLLDEIKKICEDDVLEKTTNIFKKTYIV